mmetsp:Transcript_12790/g.19248  ORF Transcript_12790/g.19248 Transcript_12790/m.19248 type:complete len:152 (-) Transcript_12790:158-613(-)|eukprot:CAMPEP_0117421620 /NCGR_PEP_ID=MMETSP0758-20121206/2654_1 /TAXON_ID=63605 /ORGANISM="Percolomonas cosmopolitus, Strain AE-1 (ATCC 50343)" /LENGTH=151 /DNA_ID=CAMNT_0005203811 /DNA_START=16 /DNA_END=471 /DNA_ORIENTATION=-
MPTRLKKSQKMRGHVSHGHGRVGKHRKHPGGRGMAGGLTHMRIWMDRFHPGYFGKVGMRRFHLKKNDANQYSPLVNLDSIWALVGQEAYNDAKSKKGGDKLPVIDVTKHGYYKVGGRGQLPPVPCIVKARFFTSLAVQKLEDAGCTPMLIA